MLFNILKNYLPGHVLVVAREDPVRANVRDPVIGVRVPVDIGVVRDHDLVNAPDPGIRGDASLGRVNAAAHARVIARNPGIVAQDRDDLDPGLRIKKGKRSHPREGWLISLFILTVSQIYLIALSQFFFFQGNEVVRAHAVEDPNQNLVRVALDPSLKLNHLNPNTRRSLAIRIRTRTRIGTGIRMKSAARTRIRTRIRIRTKTRTRIEIGAKAMERARAVVAKMIATRAAKDVALRKSPKTRIRIRNPKKRRRDPKRRVALVLSTATSRTKTSMTPKRRTRRLDYI